MSSVNVENKKIDIVLAPTKRANTLILDRISGEPIFDFRYRKVPTSKVRGEKTSPYQPFLDLPEPFVPTTRLVVCPVKSISLQ